LETKVFDAMLSLNLRSGYALARAVLPAIAETTAWIRRERDSKGGARSWSRCICICCLEASGGGADGFAGCGRQGTGVRVNSTLPSIIDTATNRRAMPNEDFAAWPKPEEIAQVILFLCSDNAA
jgi:NAD(P)-dependent dehydrogenase (short-subunit alcohol dehydrogenase family)